MLRIRVIAGVTAATLALATTATACGEGPRSTEQRVAQSVQDVVADDIPSGPAYSVLDAGCEEEGEARYRCTVDIAANPDAIQEHLRVRLGSDGCWVARRVAVNRAAGGSLDEDEVTPSVIRGCI